MPKDEVKRVATEYFKDELVLLDRVQDLIQEATESFHIWKNQDDLWELSYPWRDAEAEPEDQFTPPKRYA